MITTLPKQQFRTMYIWMLFVLLSVSACQPASTVSSSTQPTSIQIPTIEPTSTEAAIPLPTFALPTATPVPTEVTSMLTPNGPWLVYLRNYPHPGVADLPDVMAEFGMLDQDGSGRTLIKSSSCRQGEVNDFLETGSDSTNYMARFADGLYLFRPSEATGMLVNQELWYSVCHTFFNGDEKGGLLASFYQASKDVSPELILYELPGGKILERFPLVRCAKDDKVCEEFRSNWDQMGEQEPQWSPNGRYLTFAAVLDATSSDLFVYDVQNGSLRRLTNSPDWVGPIQWSRDGTKIIMQELINDGEFFFAPSSKPPSSVWSVSVSTNEIKFLYSTGDAHTEQNIRWLDDKRLIAYEGFLINADQATNLRFVDIEAGTNKILFDGDFVAESYDPIHEIFALYELESPKYPQGIYLVSIKNGTIRYLEGPPYNLNLSEWDSATGLFLTDSDCENDLQSFQAFDYQGNFKCVPKPTPTPALLEKARYPAPNGNWTISVQNGLWLEAEGKQAVRVSQETASNVIWCPDASCFFFSVLQQNHLWNLYHISLPDLTVKMVDEEIESAGGYQWLGGEK